MRPPFYTHAKVVDFAAAYHRAAGLARAATGNPQPD